MDERMNDFGDYLLGKFHLWWGREKGKMRAKPSQAEFATMLGVPTSNLSTWIQGQKKPSDAYVDQIAQALVKHRLAPSLIEVYKAAGRPPRMPTDKKFSLVAAIWYRLPDHLQDELYERVKNYIDNESEQEEGSKSY